jgi:gluconate 2-dehydrogenase alpha chain
VLPLTRAGLKVTALEAGTWMRHDQFKPDEVHNNIRALVTSVPKARTEIPTFRTRPDQHARRAESGMTMMNAIGGTSIHYYANSWRFHPWDFKARSESIKRYGLASIPKGTTLEDWPLTYDELESFYDAIEREIGVAGKAGNIQGKIDLAGNVFEGPRQREYPMPPLRGTEFTELMQTAAGKLGWNPHRSPAAINSQPHGGRPACAYHGFCEANGCHVSAKNSTAVTTIPAAQKTGNLTVLERAHVTQIVTDANGKVTGVQFLRDGREYFQPARVVLAGAYTYENVRLLLLSRSRAFPNGLSNNHGQVGKHYIGHWNGRE